LYGARMARYDLLHVCHVLACKITKWTKRCDQRLHRIMCYLHQVDDVTMMGWVGDSAINWKLWLYTDADFAADKTTSRSVSGVFCAINGPTTYFPLCALSKKQSAVSHSTAESEMIAADLGLRTEALPMMTLFDQVLKRSIRCLFLEDNQATLRIIATGKYQNLRHVSRTHRVNIHMVSEIVQDGTVDIGACESHLMAGDIFTKCFPSSSKWYDVMKLVAHMRWCDFLKLFNKGIKMDFPSSKNKDDSTITIKKEDIGKPEVKKPNSKQTKIQFAGGASLPVPPKLRDPQGQDRMLLE
jgi:hypothetical protein